MWTMLIVKRIGPAAMICFDADEELHQKIAGGYRLFIIVCPEREGGMHRERENPDTEKQN